MPTKTRFGFMSRICGLITVRFCSLSSSIFRVRMILEGSFGSKGEEPSSHVLFLSEGSS
jgi:hypothetical protein